VAFEPTRDGRRAALALLLAALALAGALGLAAVRAWSPTWRSTQADFRARGLAADEGVLGLQQGVDCAGEVERCATCHLGVRRPELAGRGLPAPFRPHPAGLLERHPPRVGCTDCHGGLGRALSLPAAHAMPDGESLDPQLRGAHQQARCARCHLPSAALGMPRVVSGAALYLELGCAICHPLSPGGRGGYDFGPELRALGRRSPQQLETSLIDPTANFPESSMPSFRATFEGRPEALLDLIVFLESLGLPSAGDCGLQALSAGWAARPCASCHAGPGGSAAGRFVHRCDFLRARAEELACARCHPGEIPPVGPGGGECPAVAAQRGACGACHPAVNPEVGP
jgi:hypothetical protein